jgi:hypothetical protein
MARRQYDRSLPSWAEQERSAVQDVRDDADARGVYSSGARLQNEARARTAVGMRQNEARALMEDELISGGLDDQRRLADMRRQAAEQELASRASAATNYATSAYGG